MSPFTLPPDYTRIKRVKSFDELISTPFGDGVNALCWERFLPFDFSEVVALLSLDEGITTLDDSRLRNLPLSASGRSAVEFLLEDQRRLRDQGLSPVLECIDGYPRDEEQGAISTDVYSFHVDSATVEADTYLCTYHGPASEGLRNEESRRRVDVPETRAKLLKNFGGTDDDEFHQYLSENCYDLHYAALPEARPFSFGLGNLWRIAVAYPGCPVPACIHRAPETLPGQSPRLLLIS